MRRRREECSAFAKDFHDFDSETEAMPLSIAISAHPAYLFAPFVECTATIDRLRHGTGLMRLCHIFHGSEHTAEWPRRRFRLPRNHLRSHARGVFKFHDQNFLRQEITTKSYARTGSARLGDYAQTRITGLAECITAAGPRTSHPREYSPQYSPGRPAAGIKLLTGLAGRPVERRRAAHALSPTIFLWHRASLAQRPHKNPPLRKGGQGGSLPPRNCLPDQTKKFEQERTERTERTTTDFADDPGEPGT